MGLRAMISKPERLWKYVADVRNRFAATEPTLGESNGQLNGTSEGPGRAAALLSEDDAQTLRFDYNQPEYITVTVACATSEKQRIKEIQLEPGATIEFSITASGIAQDFPTLDFSLCRAGVHGSVKPLDHPVQEGDRVEIYRPVEATS